MGKKLNIKKWFFISWYQYLLSKPLTFKKLICRIKGHPNGPIYYCHGSEPDYRCTDCLDEI